MIKTFYTPHARSARNGSQDYFDRCPGTRPASLDFRLVKV